MHPTPPAAADSSTAAASSTADATVGPVEIVLVVCSAPGDPLVAVAERVASDLRAALAEALPGFLWRVRIQELDKPDLPSPLEPVELITDPGVEAAAEAGDFTLVLTDRDLVARYQAFALGAPSRATVTAVASASRLGSLQAEATVRRLTALCLNLFGRLNGLAPEHAGESYASRVGAVEDLDSMTGFTEADRAALREVLERIADPRIEEQEGAAGRGGRVAFYARALRENRREFLRALLRARPWLFPLHLSRLTTAALSTLLVLVITAEAWDLALRQPAPLVAGLSLAALLGTSAFVLSRQQLLIRRHGWRLTERRVLANVTTVAVILFGFATTYLLLFAVTAGFAGLFFDRTLVAAWAASTTTPIGPHHYLLMGGFVASLGVVIGALGASFEARSHFRHVAFIDEEV